MFFIDPLYIALALPGLLLGLWAQYRVKSTFSKYAQVGTRRGMTGAEVAAAILRTEGIHDVRIEPSQGFLSDHYSPHEKALRLSPDVYQGRTIAAAGVAAHEVGHAVQHARAYAFLGMRSFLVPVVQFASPFAVPIIVLGFFLSGFVGGQVGQVVTLAGIGLFGMVVLFQLVTLPVEFDASRRALAAIERGQLLTGEEKEGAKAVLSAAAWTYVAAAVSALLTLLYFLIRSGLLGG
ncbi:MAG TPA: zinc metallopeptidase, partial [Polyangiaceae bacterium LLY-WYZ-15_(1-7)]|nr:zinc metallopeptidase [Polyangiaceae bacterium LLY-WYZ-15_(1-7)]